MKKEHLDKEQESETLEYERVNKGMALWLRPKAEISEEEYQTFYKHVSHDFDDPLAYVHNRVEGSNEYKPSPITPYYKKPHNIYMHGEAICGGRGCLRACMINLEARGAIRNQFKYPFRTQKPWTVDWSDYDPTDDRVRA